LSTPAGKLWEKARRIQLRHSAPQWLLAHCRVSSGRFVDVGTRAEGSRLARRYSDDGSSESLRLHESESVLHKRLLDFIGGGAAPQWSQRGLAAAYRKNCKVCGGYLMPCGPIKSVAYVVEIGDKLFILVLKVSHRPG
jgi:hypothetical protein